MYQVIDKQIWNPEDYHLSSVAENILRNSSLPIPDEFRDLFSNYRCVKFGLRNAEKSVSTYGFGLKPRDSPAIVTVYAVRGNGTPKNIPGYLKISDRVLAYVENGELLSPAGKSLTAEKVIEVVKPKLTQIIRESEEETHPINELTSKVLAMLSKKMPTDSL